MKKVLFLCTGNSCRSQMAESLVNEKLKNRVKAWSAGTHPTSINPYAVKVMKEIGIDISKQSVNHPDDFSNIDFDYIITLCSDAEKNCPVILSQKPVKRIHMGFPDPANLTGAEEEILNGFRKVRDSIEKRMLDFFESELPPNETRFKMNTHDEIIIKPIGIIHSPFTEQEGTPIQPSGASGIQGWVDVFPQYEEGLKDIEGFERIWLLYNFNRVKEEKLTVKPYMDTEERGVFATRAPCRINRTGMSCVRLTRREKCRLFIEDVDILDNTPLLDIKPYAPQFDVYEVTKTGWLGTNSPELIKADSRFQK
jgi:tRNA (adenine37-N6)-methyltransferase